MRRFSPYLAWLAFLIVFVLLAGCANVPSVAASRKTFTACRVADVATTTAIIKAGGVELNPLMKPLLAHGFFPFYAFQAAVIWFAWHFWDDLTTPVKVSANVISCWPVPHNAVVLKSMQ